ncbi:MAG TPA: hypothetical protein VIP11_20390 [Gemmatimonadaceae bacterium]
MTDQQFLAFVIALRDYMAAAGQDTVVLQVDSERQVTTLPLTGGVAYSLGVRDVVIDDEIFDAQTFALKAYANYRVENARGGLGHDVPMRELHS